jgi:hypothetical protein
VTGAPAPVRLTAPLSCPSCGSKVTGCWAGSWAEALGSAAQQCERCGHTFQACWPGWGDFEPETVIIDQPAQEPGRGAA